MTRFIQTADGQNLTVEQFRVAHRNVQFNTWPSQGYLDSIGAQLVEVPPTLDEARTAAHAALLNFANEFLAQFFEGAADAEPLAWVKKEEAARVYKAGTADAKQTAMIEDEAAETGELPATLAEIIIVKADLYTKVIAFTSGLRRATQAELNAATTVEEIQPILDAAKVKAEDKATALGL